MSKTNEQIAVRVSVNTIVVNVILSAFKLFAGIFGQSAAMVSDSVHSLSDVLSTGVVIAGVKLANRKPDKEHPYGHERFESVAAIILSVVLLATGAGIGWSAVGKIAAGSYGDIAVPGTIALAAAVVSLVVKEAMYWYTWAAAKKIDSSVLMADAWHHRTDALSSIGSFAGILGARLGFPIFDPIASVVICLFILKAAFDIFRDAVGKMTDKAADDKTEEEMRQSILSHKDVAGIDLLKTRLFGDKIYVDIEIGVDGAMTLNDAHDVAQRVHDVIEERFPKIKHCTVHINPVK
ncbi:MAG: cation diffusion facilitator family transporter [Oscillospiraceae bacterium]|nr:cation diffusion facilitator family transporter [Oscillospiraceae bacterium]